MMEGIKLKETIIENISHILEAHSVELVDIELKRNKGKIFITIYVDKEDGVDVQDCAELSDILGEIFDVEDLFPYSYVLEVSSPGLDRPLRDKRDFERNLGKEINLSLDDVKQKKLKGIIKHVTIDGIQLSTPRGMMDIPYSKITKAKSYINFNHVNRDT